ncbi:MAG: histidine kinase [Balneolaceae bacterium]|jgi:hypothetical protein
MKQTVSQIIFHEVGLVYLLAGILAGTSLFFITVYAGLNRNRSYLFFSSYSLLGAVSLLLLTNAEIIFFLLIFTVSCLCLLYFFMTFFDFGRSKLSALFPLSLVFLPIGSILFFGEPTNTTVLLIAWLMYVITLMGCSIISLRAFNKQCYGSKGLFFVTALIFFLMILLVSEAFFISSLSIASAVLILAVTYTILQDFRKQSELIKSLKTKAIHLENEMLKKTIQPHFLINTLTVLTEWIEDQPSLAVKQIDLLSKEFRYITRAAGKKLISIKEELEICQVHLDIFNAKRATHFVMETKQVMGDTQIPPMIFHTLIENGLTHSDAEQGRFIIEQGQVENDTWFQVSVEPLENKVGNKDGLGLTYIKSKLQEAFPDRWSLSSDAKNNAWETLITISG